MIKVMGHDDLARQGDSGALDGHGNKDAGIAEGGVQVGDDVFHGLSGCSLRPGG